MAITNAIGMTKCQYYCEKTPESNDYESIDVRNVMISSYGDNNDE